MSKKLQKGFTLIELMVVIVILGVLVAIAVPNLVQATERSRIASVKSNAHTLQAVVETYYVDYQTYPDNADEIESFDAYKIFANPFKPNFKGKATQTGNGAWWTNDEGDADDPVNVLMTACPDSDRAKGLVLYVGLDSAGISTTRFNSADGSSGGASITEDYFMYACDRNGNTIHKFALFPGSATPAVQNLLAR